MKKIIKLTEKDLTRIVKRVIKENEERSGLSQAMSFLDQYLNEKGGTLGARNPEEIMGDLRDLEHAIRLQKNDLEVASERPNPRWGMNEETEESDEVVVNVKDIAQEDMKCFSDISAADAKKVGLNHGGKYKVKKRGCMTKTRYKGPKQKYSGSNWP
jgi:hypothetical protein